MAKENIITEENKVKQNSIKIIKGTIFAIVISFIMLLIYAILLSYTTLSENTIIPVIATITGISILIGSMISTHKIKKNGLLNGCVVGISYVTILYITSSLFLAGFTLTLNSFIIFAVAIITGMVGGIIGVNLNN